MPFSSLDFVSSGFSTTDSISDNPGVSASQRSVTGFTLVDVTPGKLTLSYINSADGSVIDSFVISVPEPNSLALCEAAALFGLGFYWRKRKRAAA